MRPIEVRPAEPADVPELVDLVMAARRESLVGNQLCSADPDAVTRQLAALGGLDGGVMIVARHDEVPVGLLVGRVVGPSPFTDDASLAVEAVYVVADERRRGVGHALMSSAVELAEQAGVTHVYASPVPGARGMQRFFVQLGFGPAAGYRVSTLTALRRRLAQDLQRSARRGPQRGLEDLIARRRHSRAAVADVPVASVVAEDQDPSAAKRRQVKRAVHSRRDVESTTTIS
ncbi:GNAT family N-acetyltransferase [Actinotalea sp. M2MS4P-6]|uniref:GNAT family N-acetyltransferase n=1 Tax=Actinotalea sp. M2MS4P-6 TaxID=2983762 RepID=UPI0021E3E61A|nr:GNAT family N-acetyltransferase [Actinotalea sp. M2MS4P-6]MCV2394712.1 GNAT family N-acetyltransferase [Actinotalea sp. M2MS4P-6]